MWYWYSLAWFVGFGMGGLIMQHLYLVNLKRESNKSKNTCLHGDNYDDCPDCRH